MRLPQQVYSWARKRAVYAHALETAGIGLVVYGVWQLHHPAAFLVAGVLLIAEAITEAVR